jgi:UDP-GlcNAc:undecaprenyl-phosphate GlcNAc-1-phosphate transferase
MRELLWMTGKAFLIALILTPIVRDIFRSYNIVDRPAQRKVHAYPIPRVGGIPIAIAYLLALASASGSAAWPAYGPSAWKLLPGAGLVFLIGLMDDLFSLKPATKIFGLVVAATLVFATGVRMDVGGQPLTPWVAYPLTVSWLLLTSNALNLIDGLDGLCAGMGLLATLTLFAASILQGNYPLAYATFPMAGALLGFLCYNLNPATVFLGDSGALLIGFLLGCYGMIWTQKTSTLLSVIVPLLALSIPLLDVSLSVLRRFLKNKPIFGADRGHIHHRLLDRGLSPRQAVWVLYLFAMLAAGFALLATSSGAGRYHWLATPAFCIAAWIGIRQLRYQELDIAGRLLFRGEFYRAMDVKTRLANLAVLLDQATSEDEWWRALVSGCRSLGLVSVQWHSGGKTRIERLLPDAPPGWCFRVSLSDSQSLLPDFGSLQLEGPVSTPMEAFDLVGFGDTIRSTLAAKRVPAPAISVTAAAPGETAAVSP